MVTGVWVTMLVQASLAICSLFPPVVVTLLAVQQVSPKGFVEAALRYLAFTEPQRTQQQQTQDLGAPRSNAARQQVKA